MDVPVPILSNASELQRHSMLSRCPRTLSILPRPKSNEHLQFRDHHHKKSTKSTIPPSAALSNSHIEWRKLNSPFLQTLMHPIRTHQPIPTTTHKTQPKTPHPKKRNKPHNANPKPNDRTTLHERILTVNLLQSPRLRQFAYHGRDEIYDVIKDLFYR